MGPEAFDYHLPDALVAQEPASERAAARLMVLLGGTGAVEHATVAKLPSVLARACDRPPLVVVNDSRVVPARLDARRERDGRIFELLLCEPAPGQGPGAEVRAWVRGARRLRDGDRLAAGRLRLRYQGPDAVDPRARTFRVEAGEVMSALADAGRLPLPPYIRRPPTPEDLERYQTVYARVPGSVAAPTAGLHLDRALLADLDVAPVTLHVGPGTFLPMEAADVRRHRVGRERVVVPAETAARVERARAEGRPVLAVGTTVVRALETAARDGRVEPFDGTTDLVIRPGHRFAAVDLLLTNFHLPRSSLLMLVCAFGGRRRVLSAYRTAVNAGYRFYSYGDAMLLSPGTPTP